MLEPIGNYNQLSDQLRADIQKKADAAGRYVTYRFDIAKKNPDGERKTGGEWLYPLLWTLTPKTFDIVDPYDKKRKRIGLVISVKDDKGNGENKFRSVQIKEGWEGKYTLDMNKPDDRDVFAMLELHPKMDGGKFRDQGTVPIVRRIDKPAEAKSRNAIRDLKVEALMVAKTMEEQEIKDFAAAMGWDDSQDMAILRDEVLTIAENDHDFFRTFIDNKNIEYRAVLQRAIDGKIIAFLPVESRFIWCSNNQTIAVLDRAEGDKVMDRMCDWVITSKNGNEVYNTIKKLLSKKEKVVA